jgi:hypothetical protein
MTASPLEFTWGRFYHMLHIEAQHIRELMKAGAEATRQSGPAPAYSDALSGGVGRQTKRIGV